MITCLGKMLPVRNKQHLSNIKAELKKKNVVSGNAHMERYAHKHTKSFNESERVDEPD